MTDRRLLLLPALLAIQAAVVNWVVWTERPPAPAELSRLPSRLGVWQELRENVSPTAETGALRADRLLDRRYVDPTEGWTVDLFVAWFQTQRGGREPYSRQARLPDARWELDSAGSAEFITPASARTVQRYVVSNRGSKAVVLCWNQTPRHVLKSEWQARLWAVADAIRDRRTDTALVRVTVYSGSRTVEQTTAAASRFAQSSYPLLLPQFPPLPYAPEPAWVSFVKAIYHAVTRRTSGQ